MEQHVSEVKEEGQEAWTAPELVKMDISAHTLAAAGSTTPDGITQS